jgi:phosphoesterase RecJ-like protein
MPQSGGILMTTVQHREAPLTLSNAEYTNAAEQILSWQKPVLLSHTRPDGDALGSLIALSEVLRDQGRQPITVLYEPPPRRYTWLTDKQPFVYLNGDPQQSLAGADGVVIADTCTYTQLGPVEEWLKSNSLPTVAIDHHISRDALATTYLIDESASAACLILFEMFRAAGWSLNQNACMALYTGISTDTGWFRFSNTDPRTLRAAADLAEQCVLPWQVFELLYQHESKARFQLMSAAFNTLELFQDDRVAIMHISRKMFHDTGASFNDTEDLINYPLQIESVEASALLVEPDEGPIRVSLRSKPPQPGRADCDVAAAAATFGGGGHRRAAGARIPATLEQAKQQVMKALTSQMNAQ